MNRISKYWPDFYLLIMDYIELAEAESTELDLLDIAKNRLFEDQFVLSSSIEAVRRREKMLGIQADPTTETLDFRKKRIINRYSTKPPFTLRYLQERLDFLVGEGRAFASVDVQNFILTVMASIDDAPLFREVERTIYSIKPANMVYQQQTAIMDHITLEEHISMAILERRTRLGTWRLGVDPFAEIGPEVVIK